MEKLIVKNFGALRKIEIELKEVTIFIGETATGKSTLAKLIAIFRNADFWGQLVKEDLKSEQKSIANKGSYFISQLQYYQIYDFLESDSFFEYSFEGFKFIYENNFIKIDINQLIKTIADKISEFKDNAKLSAIIRKIISSKFFEIIYIPTERHIAASIMAENYSSFERADLLDMFSEYLKDFIGTFNKCTSRLETFHINLFKILYRKVNGKQYIVLPDDKEYRLQDSASGIQSALPAILIFEYFSLISRKSDFIFEEPELNLFPKAQKQLMELIVEKIVNSGHGHQIVITTHSPYILTPLNNLIYAHQVAQKESCQEKIATLIPQSFWLDPKKIVAYFLGGEEIEARLIIDDELKQIQAEEIDEISYKINSIYHDMMQIDINGDESDM